MPTATINKEAAAASQGSQAFLRGLLERMIRPEIVYRHRWRPGDLVMWDNRVTMHRGRRYDSKEVRDMHRTTVADVASALVQAV